MSDIFVSYASGDRAKAQMLAQFLENEGWSTFWDRTIPVGMTWNQFIGKELTETRCLVVLWSQASINSTWVQEEADEGKSRGILIPIRIEEVPPPFGFRGIQAGDLCDWDGTQAAPEFQWVVSNIARVIGASPRGVEEPQRRRAEEQARHKAKEREQVEEEAKRKADAAAKRKADAAAKRKAHAEKAEASAEAMAQHKVEVKREEQSASEREKRPVIWPFPLAVLFCQIVALAYTFAFGTGVYNEPFHLVLVVALGAAAMLAYRRRDTLSGAEISSYWLGCTLALIPASAWVFAANEWNWMGATNAGDGGLATGLLLALSIALASAVTLAYRRRGTLTGAEISSYWLGCTLALIPASAWVFAANGWNWVGAANAGDGGGATGLILAFVIALGAAAVLAYRRRDTLSGADVARYWLGCTLALLALLPVFDTLKWNWLGLVENGALWTGSLLALLIALGSGLALVLWRRKTRADSGAARAI